MYVDDGRHHGVNTVEMDHGSRPDHDHNSDDDSEKKQKEDTDWTRPKTV